MNKLIVLPFAALSIIACGTENGVDFDSTDELQEAIEANISAEEALQYPQAFRVNITTNRATYYENGVPRRAWNVGTGR